MWKISKDTTVKRVKGVKAGRSSAEGCLIRDSSMREQLEQLLQVVPNNGKTRGREIPYWFRCRILC